MCSAGLNVLLLQSPPFLTSISHEEIGWVSLLTLSWRWELRLVRGSGSSKVLDTLVLSRFFHCSIQSLNSGQLE